MTFTRVGKLEILAISAAVWKLTINALRVDVANPVRFLIAGIFLSAVLITFRLQKRYRPWKDAFKLTIHMNIRDKRIYHK